MTSTTADTLRAKAWWQEGFQDIFDSDEDSDDSDEADKPESGRRETEESRLMKELNLEQRYDPAIFVKTPFTIATSNIQKKSRSNHPLSSGAQGTKPNTSSKPGASNGTNKKPSSVRSTGNKKTSIQSKISSFATKPRSSVIDPSNGTVKDIAEKTLIKKKKKVAGPIDRSKGKEEPIVFTTLPNLNNSNAQTYPIAKGFNHQKTLPTKPKPKPKPRPKNHKNSYSSFDSDPIIPPAYHPPPLRHDWNYEDEEDLGLRGEGTDTPIATDLTTAAEGVTIDLVSPESISGKDKLKKYKSAAPDLPIIDRSEEQLLDYSQREIDIYEPEFQALDLPDQALYPIEDSWDDPSSGTLVERDLTYPLHASGETLQGYEVEGREWRREADKYDYEPFASRGPSEEGFGFQYAVPAGHLPAETAYQASRHLEMVQDDDYGKDTSYRMDDTAFPKASRERADLSHAREMDGYRSQAYISPGPLDTYSAHPFCPQSSMSPLHNTQGYRTALGVPMVQRKTIPPRIRQYRSQQRSLHVSSPTRAAIPSEILAKRSFDATSATARRAARTARQLQERDHEDDEDERSELYWSTLPTGRTSNYNRTGLPIKKAAKFTLPGGLFNERQPDPIKFSCANKSPAGKSGQAGKSSSPQIRPQRKLTLFTPRSAK